MSDQSTTLHPVTVLTLFLAGCFAPGIALASDVLPQGHKIRLGGDKAVAWNERTARAMWKVDFPGPGSYWVFVQATAEGRAKLRATFREEGKKTSHWAEGYLTATKEPARVRFGLVLIDRRGPRALTLAYGNDDKAVAPLALHAVELELAGDYPAWPKPESLWPDDAPGTASIPDEENSTAQGTPDNPRLMTGNVTRPTIAVYLPPPEKRTGAAVVVCPGGAYVFLAIGHEGHEVGRWFSERGVVAIVLKYRLPRWQLHKDAEPWTLADAHRAIRIVRSRAKEWQVDPKKVGVIGFSAGGHLAAWSALHSDAANQSAEDPLERFGSRPDFLVLVYPALNMVSPNAHCPAAYRCWPVEAFARADAPPTYLVYAADDVLFVKSTRDFEKAAQESKALLETCFFERAGHGYGLGNPKSDAAQWPDRCLEWMKRHALLRPRE